MTSQRLRNLKEGVHTTGPVVYWMSRDQRAQDNWALFHAQKRAIEQQQPLMVVFCLVRDFLDATVRQYGFMLRGLAETAEALAEKNIGFYLLLGQPEEILPQWLIEKNASMLVTDFDPLITKKYWKEKLLARIYIPWIEVDAHNIVPCWIASSKAEYGAYTIRPKIHRLLSSFLQEMPTLLVHPISGLGPEPFPDVSQLFSFLRINHGIGEIKWLIPGSHAGHAILRKFIRDKLGDYDSQSNDPTKDRQSHLSPYIHFGQVSAQRIALEVLSSEVQSDVKEAFLEQLIVRRELADNFCFYKSNYDTVQGFPSWAITTLYEHLTDTRTYLYSLEALESATTHDELWNAAQRQMVQMGKMHGYVRMYWAKKILEWSETPEQALKTAIYLNDKYQLDGRDPNGYAGIAWSIGGVHDRAWGARQIFGKVRYMSYNGMKNKFAIKEYIALHPPRK